MKKPYMTEKEIAQLALTVYLGKSCKYCGKLYKTLDVLNDAVFAEHLELACKSCWDENN